MAVSKPSSADQLINIKQIASEIQQQQSIKNKWEGRISAIAGAAMAAAPGGGGKGGKFLNKIKGKLGKFEGKLAKFDKNVSLKINKYENKAKDAIAKATGKLHGWETGFERKMSKLTGSHSWLKSHLGKFGGSLGRSLFSKIRGAVGNFFHNPCGEMQSMHFGSLSAMHFGGIHTNGFFNKVAKDISCVGNFAHRAFHVASQAVYGFRKVRQFFDESNADKLKQFLSLNCVKNLSFAGISLGSAVNCLTHKVMTNFNPGQLPMASYNSVQGNLARTQCGSLLSQVPCLSGIMQSITSGILMGDMIKNDFKTFTAYVNNSMDNTVQRSTMLGGLKHMYDGDNTVNKISATAGILSNPQVNNSSSLDYSFNGARILNSLKSYHHNVVNKENSGITENNTLTKNAQKIYDDIIHVLDKVDPTWNIHGYNGVGNNKPLNNLSKAVINRDTNNSQQPTKEQLENASTPFTINLSGTVQTNLTPAMEINIWSQLQPATPISQEIAMTENSFILPSSNYSGCSTCS